MASQIMLLYDANLGADLKPQQRWHIQEYDLFGSSLHWRNNYCYYYSTKTLSNTCEEFKFRGCYDALFRLGQERVRLIRYFSKSSQLLLLLLFWTCTCTNFTTRHKLNYASIFLTIHYCTSPLGGAMAWVLWCLIDLRQNTIGAWRWDYTR